MPNRFYSPDQRRAEKVHELFATIARRYDFLNDLMSAGLHRRWKQRVVTRALAATEPGARLLDLCCGTGDLVLGLARRQPRARICGADFTMEMLQVARTRQASARWVQADALRLPFADESFAAVTVGYGLRNLADLEQGLREIRRVLRRGGQFLSLDFGKPESAVWRRVYFGYLRGVLPLLGRAFCGDPDTHGYILTSLERCPSQRDLKTLMAAGGFVECGFEEFAGGAMALNFGRKPG